MSWNILLIALIAMVIFQILGIRMQSKKSSHLTNLINNFNDEDKFFELAEQTESEEKNNEYLQKCRVIHLWGAAYYSHNDDFKNILDKIDLSALTGKDGSISINEDAFFYLYLIIPHFLYTSNHLEQVNLLEDKLKDVNASNTFIYKLSNENKKYYLNEEDLGKTFYEDVLEGNYSGYKYSKELIGLYKNIISSMLLAIYKKENNTEKYDDLVPSVRDFTKTPLGDRWVKELELDVTIQEETAEENEESVDKEENKEEEK